MSGEVENVEVQEVQTESTNDDFRRGYERIANPDKEPEPIKEEVKPEPEPSHEPEPVIDPREKELQELREKVARIPEITKRLDDVNGRYGRLTQRFEEIQQKLATPQSAAPHPAANTEDLLKDLENEFPELAQRLKPAFSALSRPSVNEAEIKKALIDEIRAEEQVKTQREIEEARQALQEAHPDYVQDIQSQEWKEWLGTLSDRQRKRIDKSNDPYFAAEQLDAFKSWRESKTQNTAPQKTNRLAAAVVPTSGAKAPPKSEPSPSEKFRAAYLRTMNSRHA